VTLPIEIVAFRHAEVDTLYLTVADTGTLGLAVRSAEVRVRLPAPILLVPRVLPVPATRAPAVEGFDDEGSSSATRAALSGSYPRGSRPFRAGDEPRAVSWRATARSGRLTVREWDPPQRAAPVAVAVLLPHVRGPLTAGRPADADDVAAESLLSALASLGSAAADEGRLVSLTRAVAVPPTALGAGPVQTGLTTAAGLDGRGFVRELARVPEVWVAPLADLAAAAARATGARMSGTVLLGVNLAGASWLPEAFLACLDAVEREGCTLEVVVSYPGTRLPASTEAALGQLAIHCKVFRSSDVLSGAAV
jgi:hypothetical protein